MEQEPLVERAELTAIFLAIHDIKDEVVRIRRLLEEDDEDGEVPEP